MASDNSPLTPAALQVANNRYFRKDKDGNIVEDWRGLSTRVINHVCHKETDYFKRKVFNLIYHTKFLPNSPCLVNSGTKVGGLLACFVTRSPEDSWVGMCENVANFGHIARRGGGCGVDFSLIRPEGSPVFGSTHAKACGPIQHLRVVSEAMSSITQAGFRGMANMGVLRVDHPDIEKFIVCKQRDNALKSLLREDIFGHYEQLKGNIPSGLRIILDKFISNFNLSVAVTDEFMKKVQDDDEFDLVFDGKTHVSVKARKIFDLIVQSAWKNGDPGLLFYDTINDGPYKYSKQEITAANPCVTGDTIVLTLGGPRQIKDMIGRRNAVVTRDFDGKFNIALTDGAFLTRKNAKIIKIETENSVLRCTPDHKIMTEEGMKEGKYITPDQMILSNPCGLGVSYGLENTSGEKWNGVSEEFQRVSQETPEGEEATTNVVSRWIRCEEDYSDDIVFWLDISDAEEIFTGRENTQERSEYCNAKNKRDEITECTRGEESLLSVAEQSRISSKDKKIQLRLVSLTDCGESISAKFLRMDNGDILGLEENKLEIGSSRLCSPKRRDIQTRLLHLLKKWEAQEDYRSEEQIYDGTKGIQSGDVQGSVLCADRVNYRYHTICSSLFEVYSQVSACLEKVVRVTEEEELEDVYDLTVDNPAHNFIANGFVVHNCGEQVIPQLGSCNLGSIDVSKFYNDEEKEVDWSSLRDTVRTAVQFLDDVISVNLFPTDEFAKWAKENRPVGLGIMGWADLLLKKRIAYGSEGSISFAKKIASFFQEESHKKSVELGRERSTPKHCRYDELEHRRNITTISIAPTGSLSLLAGCSSSIEPIYSPITYRYDNTGKKELHHSECEKSHFRCAVSPNEEYTEVTWQQHVDMQAAFQKHCDSAISKTINMPNSATTKEVDKAYMRAWEIGCFKSGSNIYIDNGLKNIEDITVGNMVFGHDGKLHRVNQTFTLPEEERRFIDLQITGAPNLKCTANHEILMVETNKYDYKKTWSTQRKKMIWKKAQDVQIGDHIAVPKLLGHKSETLEMKISDYVDSPIIERNGLIYPSRRLAWKDDKEVVVSNSNGIVNLQCLDEDLAFFLGWFIAEGHYQQVSAVRMTFGMHEQDIAFEIGEIIERKFGLSPQYYVIESGNGKSFRLEVGSKILSEFLCNLVGKGSYNKHLPEWYMQIDNNLLKIIINEHFRGDAGVTVSESLAKQLFQSRIKLQQTPHFRQNYGEGYCVVDNKSSKETVAKKHVHGNCEYYCYRVFNKSETFESCKVYNLSVENSDSYLVNGASVHNCKGVTIYRDGCKTAQVLNSSRKTLLGTNEAEPRPKEVPCNIYKTSADGYDWHVIIGVYPDSPYELFAINGTIGLPSKGKIIKRKKRHYALLDETNNVLIENLAEEEKKIDSKVSLETRRFSLELRHRIAPKFIVQQIDKSTEVITSFSKAAGRILRKHYMTAEDCISIAEDIACPSCASRDESVEMISEAGCWACPVCSYAKCG